MTRRENLRAWEERREVADGTGRMTTIASERAYKRASYAPFIGVIVYAASLVFMSSTREPCLLQLALHACVMLGQVEIRVLSANVLFPFVLSGPSISTVITTIEVTIPAQAIMDLMKMPVEVGSSTETFIAA